MLFFSQFNYPSAWSPTVVSTQLASVGPSFVVACVPGEFTTMSGRRVRKAVAEAYCARPPCVVVIAGLCNSYSDYITTPEEYKVSELYRITRPVPRPLPRHRAGFASPFFRKINLKRCTCASLESPFRHRTLPPCILNNGPLYSTRSSRYFTRTKTDGERWPPGAWLRGATEVPCPPLFTVFILLF